MKILKVFMSAITGFDSIAWKYCFKRSALTYMRDNPQQKTKEKAVSSENYWMYITADSDDPVQDFVNGVLSAKNMYNESAVHKVIEDMDCELKLCMENMGKYYHNFRTYGLTRERAIKKAVTVCLMIVVKKYWDRDEHPLLIYRATRQQKRHGELKCDCAREFYFQVKRIMREGIFGGVLLSEKVW